MDPQPLVAKFVVLTFARARHRLGHAVKVNHCSASQGRRNPHFLGSLITNFLRKDCMGSAKSWPTGGWGELSLDKFIICTGRERGPVSKTWGVREN